jgi:hypothetical protein
MNVVISLWKKSGFSHSNDNASSSCMISAKRQRRINQISGLFRQLDRCQLEHRQVDQNQLDHTSTQQQLDNWTKSNWTKVNQLDQKISFF